ncbi:MAG: phosphatidylserine decarboxylase family protein [Lentimicrobiaceae bacterium]|jgi:phosphatidylserine decarboxylase|nr:phosphatidylserine decarboxylase family protein [Lentimicrobiaceae bacterium]MCP4911362.1 phosphatidylserine decarboxylase family protein [Bacteroidota bacterium]MBT3453810.1 phosphatidylserine decarboxylase family protein [Lentimicrobiaceae bacterium]MBT3819489.1 phosphatidylserine decarboxylase family protein [Lentimicrobiaceae bacterium]MBT4061630.1 phosphatidylserine decarboxylase family protein [Lentimicrobiaceae bacterium]
MKLHKEGYKIIFITLLILAILSWATIEVVPWQNLQIFLLTGFLLEFIWTLSFFRVPKRKINFSENHILASADGKVVAIEEVDENEFFNSKRIMVSVFMSPFNIHVNWYPIKGKVSYTKYHNGKYLAAYNPKSSTDNERNTIVVEHENGKSIMMRQIAGVFARRIISYAKSKDEVTQGQEFGIIRFGSRVDFFLPLDTTILVKLGDKVKAQQSVIGTF